MRKIFLISIVSSCLTLFIGASVQGSYTYTTLDVPGANNTYVRGIDGGNLLVDFWGSIVVDHEGFIYVADVGNKDSEVRSINRTQDNQ